MFHIIFIIYSVVFLSFLQISFIMVVADIIFMKILTVESYIGYSLQANKNIKVLCLLVFEIY